MWALGYDGSYSELWDLLEDKLVSVKKESKLPEGYSLLQNYPNPFNPTTTIKFQIPNNKNQISNNRNQIPNNVSLKIYDVLGKVIATLVNEEKQPGIYEVTFDASGLPSGTYYYQLRTGNYLQTKKMILLK